MYGLTDDWSLSCMSEWKSDEAKKEIVPFHLLTQKNHKPSKNHSLLTHSS